MKELNDAREKKEKLELQVKHVTEMLKNEIQIRQRVQREERELVSKSRNIFFKSIVYLSLMHACFNTLQNAIYIENFLGTETPTC